MYVQAILTYRVLYRPIYNVCTGYIDQYIMYVQAILTYRVLYRSMYNVCTSYINL